MAKKEVTKEEEEEKDETDESGEQDSSDGSGSPAGSDDLEDRIRKLVTETVGTLLKSNKASGSGRTAVDDESRIAQLVRDAQSKLKAEEEKEGRFKVVEETVETLKKITEKPPAKDGIGGKIQRWFWGEA